MPKFFVSQEQISNNNIKIEGQDVNHIKNVLRKKVDDELNICNKTNKENYLCKIKEVTKENIECEIIKKLENNEEPDIEVTIFQGLPKVDKMELVIQKSVELGVHKIVPVQMKRSIVKIQEKDKEKKQQRWQKISEVAAKQCGRNTIPTINQIIATKDICNLINEYDILFIAYENEKERTIKQCLNKLKEEDIKKSKIGILIGPEGGIASEEVKMLEQVGAITMSLGNRILRTETVALNVLSIIMYELE